MSLAIDPVDFRAKVRAFLREHTLDVLWLIRQGYETQAGITGELKVNRTTVSRILTYLEAEGYVASKPFRTAFTGRPEKKYRLSEKGEEFLKAVRAVNDLGASK